MDQIKSWKYRKLHKYTTVNSTPITTANGHGSYMNQSTLKQFSPDKNGSKFEKSKRLDPVAIRNDSFGNFFILKYYKIYVKCWEFLIG